MAPLMILVLVGLASVQGFNYQPQKTVLSKETIEVLRMVVNATGQISEDKTCDDCKKFLGDLKTVLGTPEFAAAVAERLCEYVPLGQEVCVSLNTKFAEYVFGYVAQIYQPDLACNLLAFCIPIPPNNRAEGSGW
ncbi:hypothetical protein SNE40_011092 [Patella caerulea]|uniref:Saposin B-type domain-containing protein n=1 Tax=Patella caerulea TaxID=87958 RepID=A0AAN8PTG4_PATCE